MFNYTLTPYLCGYDGGYHYDHGDVVFCVQYVLLLDFLLLILLMKYDALLFHNWLLKLSLVFLLWMLLVVLPSLLFLSDLLLLENLLSMNHGNLDYTYLLHSIDEPDFVMISFYVQQCYIPVIQSMSYMEFPYIRNRVCK